MDVAEDLSVLGGLFSSGLVLVSEVVCRLVVIRGVSVIGKDIVASKGIILDIVGTAWGESHLGLKCRQAGG